MAHNFKFQPFCVVDFKGLNQLWLAEIDTKMSSFGSHHVFSKKLKKNLKIFNFKKIFLSRLNLASIYGFRYFFKVGCKITGCDLIWNLKISRESSSFPAGSKWRFDKWRPLSRYILQISSNYLYSYPLQFLQFAIRTVKTLTPGKGLCSLPSTRTLNLSRSLSSMESKMKKGHWSEGCDVSS